jgi:hypothetical protein
MGRSSPKFVLVPPRIEDVATLTLSMRKIARPNTGLQDFGTCRRARLIARLQDMIQQGSCKARESLADLESDLEGGWVRGGVRPTFARRHSSGRWPTSPDQPRPFKDTAKRASTAIQRQHPSCNRAAPTASSFGKHQAKETFACSTSCGLLLRT